MAGVDMFRGAYNSIIMRLSIVLLSIVKMYYRYRAGAFGGVRSFTGVATGGTRVCSVYACTGDTRDTCGSRFSTYIANTTAIFEELTIVATMPTPVVDPEVEADNFIVYPVSVSVSILPLESSEYSYNSVRNNNVTVHTMWLNNNNAELYTFSVWGRRFATDGLVEDPPLDENSASSNTTTETPPSTTPGNSYVHLLSSTLLVALIALCFIQL